MPSNPLRSRVHALVVLSSLCLLSACRSGPPSPEPVDNPLDYVDPFIATNGYGFRIASGLPAAAAPNGMVKIGPDTNGPMGLVPFHHYSGYWYGDDRVQGFSHLHLQGTGAWDLGIISFMPMEAFDTTRTYPGGGTRPGGYESPFRKETERASAGFYAVTLDRGDIDVELTATTRTAHHRYTFPSSATEGYVVIDLAKVLFGGRVADAKLDIDRDTQRIRGRVHNLGQMSRGFGGTVFYFEVRARHAWADSKVWADGSEPAPGTSIEGDEVGAVLRFELTGEPIEFQVGISVVDPEGAAANLEAEQPAWAFEETRAATAKAWEDLVSAVRVFGGTEKERRIFYSAFYRAFLMPTTYNDVDGRYLGQDGEVRVAEGFRYFSDLSLWDTYRTVHPLYGLLAPREALDSVKSLHAMARDSNNGFPRWPLATGETGIMLGAPAEIVLADAYLKGLTDFDVEDAYQRMRDAAIEPEAPATGRGSRRNTENYIALHYLPTPHNRPASVTVELNHADFALGNLARALGKDADADLLLERRLGYRKLFDPQTGFLWMHDGEGNIRPPPFNPILWREDEFAEASAWQTLFGPQHDVEGLVELLGGQGAFVDKLTEFFEEAKREYDALDLEDPWARGLPSSFYEHGNEPSIHIPFMFAQAGRPALTQKWVRWSMEVNYDDAPAGLAGNDDGGTLSSWYVLSALGLYPIAGSDRYVVGSPVFPKAELRVPGGLFTIEADGAEEGHIYVQSATLNGAPLTRAELKHSDLRAGGSLRFVLGPQPSEWGNW